MKNDFETFKKQVGAKAFKWALANPEAIKTAYASREKLNFTPISEDKALELHQLHLGGMTYKAICEKTGLKLSKITRALAKHGYTGTREAPLMAKTGLSGRKSKLSKEKLEEAGSLYLQGFTVQQVADKFGYSRGRMAHILNEAGFIKQIKRF